MNRVTLVGRITRDPELRQSATGVAFTSFTVAVNRQAPNQQGERQADFINCVAFNKQAENLTRFVRKGGLIAVDGKLQVSSYQAQDGTTRTRTDVVCDSITFLSSPQANQQPVFNDFQYQDSYNQVPNYQQQMNNNQQSYNRNYNQQNYNQNQNFGNNYNPQNNYNPNYNPNNNVNNNVVNNNMNNSNYNPKPTPMNEERDFDVEEKEEKVDNFKEVENQFDISDDDLPF